jgi:hypothetical protein
MKRIFSLFVVMIMMVSLVACGEQKFDEIGFGEVIDGRECDFDLRNAKITVDDELVLHYRIQTSYTGTEVYIIYPDDEYCGRGEYDGPLQLIKSEGYDPEKYMDANGLINCIVRNKDKVYDAWENKDLETESDSGWDIPFEVIAGILMIIFGIIYTLKPKEMWAVEDGWKYKDAEPSDIALGVNRVWGVVSILIGALILLFSI